MSHPSYADPLHQNFFFADPFSPPPSSSRPRPPSVITIPITDEHSVSPPSRPPSSSSNSSLKFRSKPSPAKVIIRSSVDLAAAATRIQSRFRGFSIRRHHPLLHLRTIATAHEQLEGLKIEFESPMFTGKLKKNEKERIKFNEAIMAVILRLDFIQGSIPEVRLRRKEAIKTAMKLQDAVDAMLLMQEDLDIIKQVDSTASNANRVFEESVPLDQHRDIIYCSHLDVMESAQEAEVVATDHLLKGDTLEDVDQLQAECLAKDCGMAGDCVLITSKIEKEKDLHIVSQAATLIGVRNDSPFSTQSEMKMMSTGESAGLAASSDRVLLQQLSEDCKQMKSMLSTLLVQSRYQNKVICALGDRLETLEHQQHIITCSQQHNKGDMTGKSRRRDH